MANVSLLHEIAVRAKWDGFFTQEWSTIRSYVFRDGSLVNYPGDNNMQKLNAWANSEGLVMGFDMEFGGFSSEIRSVTFWNPEHAYASAMTPAPEDGEVADPTGQPSETDQAPEGDLYLELDPAMQTAEESGITQETGLTEELPRPHVPVDVEGTEPIEVPEPADGFGDHGLNHAAEWEPAEISEPTPTRPERETPMLPN